MRKRMIVKVGVGLRVHSCAPSFRGIFLTSSGAGGLELVLRVAGCLLPLERPVRVPRVSIRHDTSLFIQRLPTGLPASLLLQERTIQDGCGRKKRIAPQKYETNNVIHLAADALTHPSTPHTRVLNTTPLSITFLDYGILRHAYRTGYK